MIVRERVVPVVRYDGSPWFGTMEENMAVVWIIIISLTPEEGLRPGGERLLE